MSRVIPLNRYCRLLLATLLYLFVLITSHYRNISCYGFHVITSTTITATSSRSYSYAPIHAKVDESRENDYSSNQIIFNMTEVDTENLFSCSNFAATKFWGKSPLLMRGAFHSQSDILMENLHQIEDGGCGSMEDNNEASYSNVSFWPTWDDVMELALEEDAESRLITATFIRKLSPLGLFQIIHQF